MNKTACTAKKQLWFFISLFRNWYNHEFCSHLTFRDKLSQTRLVVGNLVGTLPKDGRVEELRETYQLV